MANKWITVSGIVIQGHRVASAPSEIYPYGSLVKQIPNFKILGLDLTGYHPGTINISIIPKSWRMVEADYTFQNVAWTNLHPPEDFSFSTSRINFNDQKYHGWIYYPHPDTKAQHRRVHRVAHEGVRAACGEPGRALGLEEERPVTWVEDEHQGAPDAIQHE